MPSIPTIAISNADGSDYIIINQADYNPEIHTVWEAGHLEESTTAPVDQEPVVPDKLLEPEFVAQQNIEKRAQQLADTKTLTDLKAMAKDLSISGYSKMNQADLSKAIAEAESAHDN